MKKFRKFLSKLLYEEKRDSLLRVVIEKGSNKIIVSNGHFNFKDHNDCMLFKMINVFTCQMTILKSILENQNINSDIKDNLKMNIETIQSFLNEDIIKKNVE